MPRIFAGLSLYLLIFLVAACVLGFMGMGHPDARELSWHRQLGIFSAAFVCLVHSMVMFHFVGSRRSLKEVALQAPEGAAALLETHRLQHRLFPAAFSAVGLTVATAVMGGAADTGALPGWIHGTAGVLTLLLNGWAAPLEWRLSRRNTEILERLNAELTAAGGVTAGAAGSATGEGRTH